MELDELKKIVELAEGFNWKPYSDSIIIYFHYKTTTVISGIRNWLYYPLMIRRAVEGWNFIHATELNGRDYIDIVPGVVRLIVNDLLEGASLGDQEFESTDNLTCEEQAIEAILSKAIKL